VIVGRETYRRYEDPASEGDYRHFEGLMVQDLFEREEHSGCEVLRKSGNESRHYTSQKHDQSKKQDSAAANVRGATRCHCQMFVLLCVRQET